MAHAPSKAVLMLTQLGGTQDELAERFGVSRRTIVRWLGGATTPTGKERERVCLAGGPRPHEWDEAPPPSAAPGSAPPPPPGSGEAATAETTRELANRLHAIASAEIERLERDADPETVAKRLASLERLGGVVVQLGKLTGAALLDERRIVASPAWRRLEERFTAALTPWPDALAAVAAALEAV